MRKNPPKNAQFLANFSFLLPVNESKISKIVFIFSGERKPLLNGVLIRGLSKDLIALWLIVLRKLILLS